LPHWKVLVTLLNMVMDEFSGFVDRVHMHPGGLPSLCRDAIPGGLMRFQRPWNDTAVALRSVGLKNKKPVLEGTRQAF
jgi:hypothetical protein